MPGAFVTIAAKNYLAHTRVLLASVEKWHPDALRILILVDDVEGCFSEDDENYAVIPSSDLPVPNGRWFHFKYGVLELSTALKPYALEWLIDRFDLDWAIYLDPDTKLYNPLDPVLEALRRSNIILTPHLLEAIDDEYRPGELDILKCGSYNLGFIAVAACSETSRFLEWWQKRLLDQCVVDLARGLFVDQKWIDLAPGLFDGVEILRDPGLNVAYWNIHGRCVQERAGEYVVNGEPLYFFHFSGFDPENVENFSRHQDRFTTEDLGGASELVHSHAKALLKSGHAECKSWPYAYGTFEDGTILPDVARRVHREDRTLIVTIEDPFSADGLRAFLRIWNSRTGGGKAPITRLARWVYDQRPDVQNAFPDIFGSDRNAFIDWFVTSGKTEYQLPEALIAPLRDVSKHRRKLEGNASAQRVDVSVPLRSVYEARVDLHQAFPEPEGRHRLAYLTWLLTFGRIECELNSAEVEFVRNQWSREAMKSHSALARVWYRAKIGILRASARLRNGGQTAFSLQDRADFCSKGSSPQEYTVEKDKISTATRNLGLNAVGYFHAEMGIGEAARGTVLAARSAGVDVALKVISTGGVHREQDRRLREDTTHLHGVNLIHANADQTPIVMAGIEKEFLEGRRNIGYWSWETEDFPVGYRSAFDLVDEVWTPSRFSQDALCRQATVPVVRIPHAVEFDTTDLSGREYLGLPTQGFVFCTAFDMLSIFERKNPLAVVKAFREAFSKPSDTWLVVKVSNADRNSVATRALYDACTERVKIIDETLDRKDAYSLFAASDCFVSLHRCEGFGLTLAEAMFLGKPVIATAYSGNVDFTTISNSFLVDYKLVPIPGGCDPYVAGGRWADPSISHAVSLLRQVRFDEKQRNVVAKTARQYVREHLSRKAVGHLIRQRLEVLRGRVRGTRGDEAETTSAAATNRTP